MIDGSPTVWPVPVVFRLRHAAWLVLLAIALALAGTVQAMPEGARIGELSLLVTGSTATPDRVLGGVEGRFEPIEGEIAYFGGDVRATYWLRIELDIPAGAPGNAEGEPAMLWMDRVPLRLARLHQPGTPAPPQSFDFFSPSPAEALLPGGRVFELAARPEGRSTLLLELRSPIRLTLRPVVVAADAHADGDRLRALLFSAMYAGMVVLALLSLALFVAIRERGWLALFGFAVGSLLALLAYNGHLYAVPGFGLLGRAGVGGVLALVTLAVAAMLVVCAQLSQFPALGRRWRLATQGVLALLLGLAVVGLAAPDTWAHWLRWLMAGSWTAALVGCAVAATITWRRGQPAGAAVVSICVGLLGFAALHLASDHGLVAPGMVAVYGVQYALAGACFLFSFGQADRMMEFRRLRERTRQDKARADADLRAEQVRRRFIEALQVGTRGADTSDVEWLAFRRLLESVRELVPQQGSAVIAFGYHGLDLLLAEPLGLKHEYTRLLARRGSAIKSLCRSRKPVMLPLEEIALDDGEVVPGGVFAVVPLHMAKPAWGVLLVQRQEGSEFSHGELQLLSEFAQTAVAAADEASDAVDLRRHAEIDPLTGALNRRAMDGRLLASVERAHAERLSLSLLFVDLDHFKQVNDHHGHSVGDDCLRLVSDCIRRHLRKHDLFGRFGGEEFIVVLPDCNQQQARELAERIREAIAALCVVGEANVRFTVSIGLACRLPSEKQPKPIIDRADKALYRAKRAGRNQVQVASVQGFGVEGIAPGWD